jgi:hypothetical protein
VNGDVGSALFIGILIGIVIGLAVSIFFSKGPGDDFDEMGR